MNMPADCLLRGMVWFVKGLDFSYHSLQSIYFNRTIHANKEETAPLEDNLYKWMLMLCFVTDCFLCSTCVKTARESTKTGS